MDGGRGGEVGGVMREDDKLIGLCGSRGIGIWI